MIIINTSLKIVYYMQAYIDYEDRVVPVVVNDELQLVELSFCTFFL